MSARWRDELGEHTEQRLRRKRDRPQGRRKLDDLGAPSEEDIATIHALLRRLAPAGTRLLYGGSVKPGNAPAILALPNVDGVLVGGASLAAADFLAIAAAAALREA